jgi:hypothetical protein
VARDLDLNLLPIAFALYDELSVSRAARLLKLHWHRRFDNEPRSRWFRDLLARVFQEDRRSTMPPEPRLSGHPLVARKPVNVNNDYSRLEYWLSHLKRPASCATLSLRKQPRAHEVSPLAVSSVFLPRFARLGPLYGHSSHRAATRQKPSFRAV